jgi:REP element-mobilizing transposase RayT
MPQSLAKCYVHIIFSTKNRLSLLDDDIRDQMYAYLASILQKLNCSAIIIGGTGDHVHILCHLSRTETIANVILKIKRNSSKWMKTKGIQYKDFQWQNGYGVFSVSHSNISQVRNYIIDQEGHHKQVTFEEELRTFLKKHDIEFDEQYLWD